MAGRITLPINRTRTSLDQERENFEKNQTLSISKAVSDIEVPVKAKHVRSAIIGTFQDKGSHTFWSIVHRLPIHSNPIIAWKFCHTLHKVLREGHPNCLKDSVRHREFLKENGKLWGHFKDGYGKLIYIYCRLLVVKLDFHRRNPKFPGNLLIKDDELELICENDINSYFQLSVELLDYMDEILGLQIAVFGSLDMSRSNSMTNAGQCRLSPLIPCIQDSSQVYDFIVKLLFKLHNCLPPETLEGHRIRFLKQFKALRQFYLQSSTLQYFKTLIQVPHLDENPPNFLISSEIHRHVTPVVILPTETTSAPQDDVSLVQLDGDPSERNESPSPDLLAERDRYIEHLLHQIEQLSTELHALRSEWHREVGDLRQIITDLELHLLEKESEIEEALKGKQEIEKKLSDAAQSAQLGSVVQLQLQETEKRAKVWEEKFSKLKDVYQKLRDEHIGLLRQKADADKKLLSASTALEESNKIQLELQDSLELAKNSAKEADVELCSREIAYKVKIKQLTEESEELKNNHDKLKESLSDVDQTLAQLNSEIAHLKEEKRELLADIGSKNAILEQNSNTCKELEGAYEQLKEQSRSVEEAFETCKLVEYEKSSQLTREKELAEAICNQLQETLDTIQHQCETLTSNVAQLEQQKNGLNLQIEKAENELKEQHAIAKELKNTLTSAKTILQGKEEEFESFKTEKENAIAFLNEEQNHLQALICDLEESLSILKETVKQDAAEIDSLRKEKHRLLDQISADSATFNNTLLTNKTNTAKWLNQIIVDCSLKAEQYAEACVMNVKKPATMAVQDCNGISSSEALNLLELLTTSLHAYCLNSQNEETAVTVIPLLFPFAQSIGSALSQGQLLAHSIPDMEKADLILSKCIAAGNLTTAFYQTLQQPFQSSHIDSFFDQMKNALQDLNLGNACLEAIKCDDDKEHVGEKLENELAAMERDIEEAASRIAKLWDSSRQTQTGVKLEVNEKVLDSCTALMKAIIELIKKAKVLQEEIVLRGKGSATAKEFYKRNHRWTEGLLSAAKAVGFGAKLLTDAADRVVQGHAKFEQLSVASQEIAASTAQLVFASRVKAELESKNLRSLAEASKAVSAATGGVLATAKRCAALIEDSTVLDFSNLSLHQAKRLEMESQVKVLELESSLEKERFRLSALRKQHYQLAGDMNS